MKRRDFLKVAGAGVAAGAAAGPALAQSQGSTPASPAVVSSMPELRWRLTSGFPKSLDTIYGASETFAKYVSEATDGRWTVQPFAAGEIVGAFQAAEAIGAGTVEMGHTASYYYVGKDPTFALGTSLPFGMNSRQMNAWMYHGGGIDLMNEFYQKQGIYAVPGGNTGCQMGGWYRKEIKTPADLQGLKFRTAGLAGQVLSKLGAVPQAIPGGDIYPALERGTIDAAEWVGPYDDERLGFAKVAPYYYYPGWWEGGPMLHFFFNKAKWDELPKTYKALAQAAAGYANVDMQAKYDARNPAALRRLVGAGAQLRPFSQEIMEACFKAANELYDEISGRNADFKKTYEAFRQFRGEQYLWFQVAEYSFDNFMIRARARG
jgi:TRAP-type mannitol/chloroaromatic compound transport system substrate-binding protein